jgi:hypothetical protein
MKKAVLFLIVISLILVACGGLGGNEPPVEERIVGKWSGLMVNVNGDRVPVEWEFLDGGTMVTRISMVGISYGGTWSVGGNRINFVTEVDPEKKNYRDVEFVSDDVMKLTKAESNIVETWTRVEE